MLRSRHRGHDREEGVEDYNERRVRYYDLGARGYDGAWGPSAS
jgi:hypothetical protein